MTGISLSTSSTLQEFGFTRYRRDDFTAGLDADRADELLAELTACFKDLPPDPYALGTNRYRRYARAVVVPWERSIKWVPVSNDDEYGEVTEYYQGDHNPEYPGARRRFPAISSQILGNQLLRQILLFDLNQALWLEALQNTPVHVGVHLIRLSVDADHPEAISSPNVLHQDGEPFTFAHLIIRDNIDGGVNVIAPPRCAGLTPDEVSPGLITATFTLDQPLDSYAVHDPKVSHYVSPVCPGAAGGSGERGVILVDFTPFVPQI